MTSKLCEVIDALARIRVFISHTDHLNDWELYSVLWHELLRAEHPMLPYSPQSAWHADLLGGWSEADTYVFLKYYADEDWRQHWLKDFADFDLPAHANPPFDRDRHLPQPDDDLPTEPDATTRH